jgi:hypothetical protein
MEYDYTDSQDEPTENGVPFLGSYDEDDGYDPAILSVGRNEADGEIPLEGLPNIHSSEGQTDLCNA